MSRRTTQRQLAEDDTKKWLTKERLLLEASHRRIRMQWAREHRNWTFKQWAKVIQSDESIVRLGSRKQLTQVFQKPYKVWLQKNIKPYIRGIRAIVMVWGCFYRIELEDIAILRGYTNKRTRSVTREVILQLYQQMLPEICEDNSVFMQDNALVYTTAVVKNWL